MRTRIPLPTLLRHQSYTSVARSRARLYEPGLPELLARSTRGCFRWSAGSTAHSVCGRSRVAERPARLRGDTLGSSSPAASHPPAAAVDAAALADARARHVRRHVRRADNTPEDMATYVAASFGEAIQRAELADPRDGASGRADGQPWATRWCARRGAGVRASSDAIEIARLYAGAADRRGRRRGAHAAVPRGGGGARAADGVARRVGAQRARDRASTSGGDSGRGLAVRSSLARPADGSRDVRAVGGGAVSARTP